MSIIEMLEQSGIMALVGMGVVFSFLVILVIAITITSKLIGKFDKPEAVFAQTSASANEAGQQVCGDGAVIAAISAAVNLYRENK